MARAKQHGRLCVALVRVLSDPKAASITTGNGYVPGLKAIPGVSRVRERLSEGMDK